MKIKRLFNFKISPWLSIIFLITLSLFCTHQILKAAGTKVFAGKVVYTATVEECLQYEYDACSGLCPMCGCGPHNEIDIAPIFGGDESVTQNTYVCQSASYVNPGNDFEAVIGAVVFGSCTDEELVAWSPECNVAAKIQ